MAFFRSQGGVDCRIFASGVGRFDCKVSDGKYSRASLLPDTIKIVGGYNLYGLYTSGISDHRGESSDRCHDTSHLHTSYFNRTCDSIYIKHWKLLFSFRFYKWWFIKWHFMIYNAKITSRELLYSIVKSLIPTNQIEYIHLLNLNTIYWKSRHLSQDNEIQKNTLHMLSETLRCVNWVGFSKTSLKAIPWYSKWTRDSAFPLINYESTQNLPFYSQK